MILKFLPGPSFFSVKSTALVVWMLLPVLGLANKDYEDGKKLASELTLPKASEVSTKDVPAYAGEQVPEKDYLENPHRMNEKAASLTQTNGSEAGKVIQGAEKTKREFHEVIYDRDKKEGAQDIKLIREANDILADPLKEIKGTLETDGGQVVEVLETTHTCEEAGEPEEHSCDWTPVFEKKEIIVYRKIKVTLDYAPFEARVFLRESSRPEFFLKHFKGINEETGEKIPFDMNHIKEVKFLGGRNRYGGFDRSYGHLEWWYKWLDYEVLGGKKDIELIEHWQTPCAALEAYVDQNKCLYKSKICVEGPQTRMIHGKPVHQDCWRERRTYLCQTPSLNNCGPFRAQGCTQTKVDCLKRVNGTCVSYKKTFTCRSEKKRDGLTRIKGNVPFCLDGNCDKHGWDANKDFALAMSKLAIFREMAKDMKSVEPPTVFRGKVRGCTRAVIGFQDCCGGNGGWGQSMGLANNCSPDEKLLHKEKGENKCVFVGTHCIQRDPVLKTCLKKQSSYCCFGSKIAKIFHEQGRAQLGIGWGSSEQPNCQPFSVEELQRIDFGKIDLSALFGELQAQTNLTNMQHTATALTNTWNTKVKAIKRGDKQGGSDGVF